MQKIIPATAIIIPDQAKRVFKGVIFDVYQWQQNLFDNTSATFEMLKRPDTVVIMPLLPPDQLVLVEDEQPNRLPILTFPTGRVEPTDDSTLSAAKRELKEETGYTFKQWRLVSVTQPYEKIEWFVYTYITWDVIDQSASQPDPGEHIKLQLSSLPVVQKLMTKPDGTHLYTNRLLDKTTTLEDLLNVPEYNGRSIIR